MDIVQIIPAPASPMIWALYDGMREYPVIGYGLYGDGSVRPLTYGMEGGVCEIWHDDPHLAGIRCNDPGIAYPMWLYRRPDLIKAMEDESL